MRERDALKGRIKHCRALHTRVFYSVLSKQMRNWDALKVPIKTLPDLSDSEGLLGTLKLERENGTL